MKTVTNIITASRAAFYFIAEGILPGATLYLFLLIARVLEENGLKLFRSIFTAVTPKDFMN